MSSVRERLLGLELRPKEDSPRPPSYRGRDLGDLLITDWEAPAFEGVRGGRMAADDEDVLLLLTARKGEMGIELPDRSAVLRPGSVMLLRSRITGRVGA